jgi:hypothetical protein
MKLVVEKEALIAEGKPYRAELIDVKECDTGKYGAYIRFTFALLDEAGSPIVSDLCSAKLTVGGKLYRCLSVLNGANLDLGTEIEPSDYVGRVVELTVKNVEDDGRVFTNVDSLVRLINNDGNVN